MKRLLSLCLLPLFACGGVADDTGGPLDGPVAPESAPAVVRGGFIDPPSESPATHDIELSDGDTSYRVMFGVSRDGQTIVDRVNSVTGATIEAHLSEGGYLYLTSVETGSAARIIVLRGAALPMLGLDGRPSASGR